jgi:hypothetical protein
MKQGDFNAKFGIPYPSLQAMVDDNFAKVGGPLEAAELVVAAIKQNKWRSDYQDRKKEQMRKVTAFLNSEEGKRLEASILKGRK